MIEGKPNCVLVGHIGIIDHDRVLVSLAKPHYTNQGIKASRTLSINIVDEALLPKADYVGCVSGRERNKSEVFPYQLGEAGTSLRWKLESKEYIHVKKADIDYRK